MFSTSSLCLHTMPSDSHGLTPLEEVQPFLNPKTRGEISFGFALNEASENINVFFWSLHWSTHCNFRFGSNLLFMLLALKSLSVKFKFVDRFLWCHSWDFLRLLCIGHFQLHCLAFSLNNSFTIFRCGLSCDSASCIQFPFLTHSRYFFRQQSVFQSETGECGQTASKLKSEWMRRVQNWP